MNIRLVLPLVFFTSIFYSCKDASTNPQPTQNSIEGTWEYSGDVGFVDIIDPLNPFFPKFIFNTDNSFDESARFVLLPSKEYIGYKYVKTGSYNITSDTITQNIINEIYVSFEDSLQEKPTPLPVNSYIKNYKFIIVADTLKMALLGVTGLNFIDYIKQ